MSWDGKSTCYLWIALPGSADSRELGFRIDFDSDGKEAHLGPGLSPALLTWYNLNTGLKEVGLRDDKVGENV